MTVLKYAVAAAVATLWAGAAAAQTTPTGPIEVLGGTADAATQSTGPEWWAFSRGAQRNYLIDVNSVVKTGDELTVMVARVPKDTAAGDYSYTLDQFGIRCRARQSHVVTSADALEDGVPGEAFVTDEPWEAIARDSFDDAIREITCDDMRPSPPAYPTVKAYIDAGRP
ncbi:hypothetical protein ACETK8_03440 [Brevundimonas staleyi]|uniref:Uncharacterized protein n=1 Tax=Brevundimonas staleyi TaxID=74326 RepID=A0ABW0FUF9_9CAUL